MITPRENLLRIFSQGEPEYIPVTAGCDDWNQPRREGMDPDLSEKLGDITSSDDSVVILSRYLGIDIMDRCGPPVKTIQNSIKVEYVTEGYDTTTIWHTSKGDLRQVMRRSESEERHPPYFAERVIKSAGDLPLFAEVFADQEYEYNGEQAAEIKRKRELIGDDGVLQCHMNGTPMGMLYRVFSGVENLAYLYIDAPNALADLFAVMEQKYQEQIRFAVQSDIDMVVGIDDTSTTVISPAMFEQYNIELTNERVEICHEAGKRYLHHSCGLIQDLIPVYNQTKMDGVHAYTEPPVGNADYVEGRRILNPEIGIRTSTPGFMSNVGWDRERMKETVKKIFANLSPKDRFVFNMSAMPNRTVAEMQEAVEESFKHRNICATV